MSFLYVFKLSNIDTLQYRNIAFICCKKNNEFSLLKVGGITDKNLHIAVTQMQLPKSA